MTVSLLLVPHVNANAAGTRTTRFILLVRVLTHVRTCTQRVVLWRHVYA